MAVRRLPAWPHLDRLQLKIAAVDGQHTKAFVHLERPPVGSHGERAIVGGDSEKQTEKISMHCGCMLDERNKLAAAASLLMDVHTRKHTQHHSQQVLSAVLADFVEANIDLFEPVIEVQRRGDRTRPFRAHVHIGDT